MTKNSMLMQTPYFSVVEGFRQFVRDSVRTEKDHYRWVNLYGEKGLDDPNPKVVEIQDEKAEQLAVACATLAYLRLRSMAFVQEMDSNNARCMVLSSRS